MTDPVSISGETIRLIEFDCDAYYITQFEATRDTTTVRNWTASWSTTGVTLVADDDPMWPSGKSLSMVKASGASYGLAYWNLPPNIQNTSILAYVTPLITTPSSGHEVGVALRAVIGATANGYAVTIKNDNTLSIIKLVAGVATTLTSVAFSYVGGVPVWVLGEVINTVTGPFLRCKAWSGELSDEPDIYLLSTTDTALNAYTSAGPPGLLIGASSPDAYGCGVFRVRSLFQSSQATARHNMAANYVPLSYNSIPDITDIDFQPATLSLGENLGKRAQVITTFADYRGADLGEFFLNGTAWGKFRARKLFTRGLNYRLLDGLASMDLTDFSTRYFYTDTFNGPTPDDKFMITALDILKFADDNRSQAPAPNSGFLSADILAVAITCNLLPTGIGNDEYNTQGYINIAGSEICLFSRDGGIDQYTMALWHCNGLNTATTFPDSSGRGHTATANGNAQVTTANSKFGGASCLLDGTGDFLTNTASVDFAAGNSDFTVDFWFRLNAVGAQRIFYDDRPNGVQGLYITIGITAGNVIFFFTNSSTRITGATTVATGAFHYVMLARHQGVTRLFLDGVQQGVDYTDTNNYINGTVRPMLGANGNTNGTTEALNGWLDEVRFSKGIARQVNTPFIVPGAEFSATSGDRFELTRGQYGTTAADHSSEDRAQQCLEFLAKTAAYIADYLFTLFANIPADLIPIYDWETECSTYLGVLYGRLIPEPTGINELVSDLIKQAGLIIWWDNLNRVVQLKVLRGIDTNVFEYNEGNFIRSSLTVTEQPTKQLTEAWTYYGTRNPLTPLDQLNNYRSQYVLTDLEAATINGTALITKIPGTWIPTFGSSAAQRAVQLQLGRYVSAPRKVTFDIARYSGVEEPVEAGGYRISYHGSQDEIGSLVSFPIQVTRVATTGDKFSVEAEEMTFKIYNTTSLLNRVITIDSNINNIDLYALHNSIYPMLTAQDVIDGVNLTVIINSGVLVGADTTVLCAFDVGTSWPVGFPILITNNGRVQGCGGKGGDGIPTGGGGVGTSPGLPGGTALYCRFPISFDNTNGQIWGGGGGGFGGYSSLGGISVGGGGGCGDEPGLGGLASSSFPGQYPGNPGTTEVGGNAGLVSAVASNGGGPGLPGGAGSGSDGAAGDSIDGISHITSLGAGDVRGPQVN